MGEPGLCSLSHLAVFMEVVDTGSFTAAARRLGLSKPTVSKHVSTLEKHLGARLLNRTTRSLGLTEVGSHFYSHCRKIMVELEAAEIEVSALSGGPRGVLKVAAPSCFGDRCLAPKLGEFLELYPDIAIDLTLESDPRDLVSEGYDLAIRILRAPPDGVRAKYLAPCGCMVCGTPTYLRRHGAPALPGDLEKHHCLTCTHFDENGGWRLVGPEGPVLVKVSGRVRVNDGDALRAAVISGLGLGLLPCFLVEDDVRQGRLLDVLPGHREDSLGVYAVFPQDDRLSLKTQAFVDYLARELAAGRDRDLAAAAIIVPAV